MSQFNAPVRRTGGDLDVYTSLLCVAFLVLVGGCILMAMRNTEHSRVGNDSGQVFKLIG